MVKRKPIRILAIVSELFIATNLLRGNSLIKSMPKYRYTGFYLTEKILEAWYPPEEFKLITTFGALGYGKSAFAFKVLVQLIQILYDMTEEESWELVKQFIVFHPEQFFQKIDEIEENLKFPRIPSLVWDDAGLWLYALDWNDPFVKAFGKYVNVCRTHLASLILTTPSPDMVFKKIRKFPQAFNVKIIKRSGGRGHLWHRLAIPYLQYYNIVKGYRVMRCRYKRGIVEEPFNCRMPDKFYAWYKPLRDSYEDIALAMIKKKWEELKAKDRSILSLYYSDKLAVPALTLKL